VWASSFLNLPRIVSHSIYDIARPNYHDKNDVVNVRKKVQKTGLIGRIEITDAEMRRNLKNSFL
jgi:hypothetical protein